jgi:hypothetical protein
MRDGGATLSRAAPRSRVLPRVLRRVVWATLLLATLPLALPPTHAFTLPDGTTLHRPGTDSYMPSAPPQCSRR